MNIDKLSPSKIKKVSVLFGFCDCFLLWFCLNVTLDHKSSLKSLGYICSNSQKYTVWVKIIDFSLRPKIISILNKDHDPLRYFVNLQL